MATAGQQPRADSIDVGRVLVKALTELAHLKHNYGTPDGAASLEKAEALLRRQAELILSSGMPAQLEQHVTDDGCSRVAMVQKPLDFKRRSQRVTVESADSLSALKFNLLHNPTSEMARIFLNHRFGIPLPAQPSSGPARGGAAAPQNGVLRGTTVDRPALLPRQNRENPFAPVPLHYVDREIRHGLYHLINRGIIPACSNLTGTLTGENNVLHTRQSVLLPFHLQFCRAPCAEAVGTSSAVKLDMLTPVHRECDSADCAVTRPRPPNDAAPGCIKVSVPTTVREGVDSARVHADGAAAGGVDAQSGALSDGASDAGSCDDADLSGPASTRRRRGKLIGGNVDWGSGAEALEEVGPVIGSQIKAGAQPPPRAPPRGRRPSHDAAPPGHGAGPPPAGRWHGDDEPPGTETHRVVQLRPADASTVGPEAGARGQQRARDAREYEALMDDHSRHYVLIRKGVALDETPEFSSFHRTYAELWQPVAEYLLRLEGICTQYAVPLATVDGRALAELARATGSAPNPPMDQLLACIVNIQDVAAILRQPGRRFLGPDGLNAAATLIQAHVRGRSVRTQGKSHVAARQIQAAWRTHQLQEALSRRLHEERAARDDAFARLQARLREEWDEMMTAQRVIVHVPSLTLTPEQRAALPNVPLAENAQMARLCDVADPLCDVVYVAPFPVDAAVEDYWEKLLEVGGVEAPKSRLRIIFPENFGRLPERMSLTTKLLASPRAMRRLQLILQGRKAFIVPGVPGDSEIDLAVALNVPLLAPHPMLARALSTKSGARALFRGARMNVAPGVSVPPVEGAAAAAARSDGDAGSLALRFAMRAGELQVSENAACGMELRGGGAGGQEAEGERGKRVVRRKDAEFCLAVARAMVEHMTVQRWLVKIEDEDNGRGHAYFDVAKLQDASDLLQKLAARLEELSATPLRSDASSRGATPRAAQAREEAAVQDACDDARQAAVHKLNAICLAHLRKTLKIVAPGAFRDYRSFIQAIRSRGAVIEAAAAAQLGSPTVNMLIEPTGAVKIVCTLEQIFCPAYRAVGHSFPQASVVHSALHDASVAIGEALAAQNVIGHVSVDFVVLRENGLLRMWATDLGLCPTQSLASFQLFDFLAAGHFDARRGTYTVSEDPDDATSVPSTRGLNYEPSVEPKSEVGRIVTQRHFVSCEACSHPGLATLDYGQLFNRCRGGGRVFDMEDRTGTAFALMDGATAGVLSALCVGHTLYDALSEMAHTLEFLDGTAADAAPGASAQATEFRATCSTVRYLADRLAPLVVAPKLPVVGVDLQ